MIFDNALVDTDKTYTLVYDIIENTLFNNDSDIFYKFNIVSYNDGCVVEKTQGVTGRRVHVLKQPSVSTGTPYIEISRTSVGKFSFKNPMILEGNWSNKNIPQYIDGITSSFEDQLVTQDMISSGKEKAENLGKYKVEYKVTGKNKLNGAWEKGHAINGVEAYSNNIARSLNFIKVEPNKTYSLSKFEDIRSNYRLERINFYKDGVYVSKSWDNTFTVPDNCNEIKILICNNEAASMDTFKEVIISEIPIFQLEEGSLATEYEPYKESIKTFYLNSPLLEGDTIQDVDGKATHIRRSEKIVLDGSENWINTSVGTPYFYATVLNHEGYSYGKGVGYCDKLPYIQVNSTDINYGVYAHYGNKNVGLRIDGYNTVSDIKNWLSNNPITVVYNLMNPINETISEESILIDSYKDGHLDLNTDISINKVDFKSTHLDLNYLYPNTDYIVQFESDSEGITHLYCNYNITQATPIKVKKGVNKAYFTTPSTIQWNAFDFNGIGFNLSNLVVTEAVDEHFDYFEGVKSVGQDDENGHNIEVISNNKNLFDIENINFDKHIVKEGDIYVLPENSSTTWITSDAIKVNPDTTYSIKLQNGISPCRWAVAKYKDVKYDILDNSVLEYAHSNDTITFTTTNSTSEVYIAICNDGGYVDKGRPRIEFKVQLEKNNTSSSYVPYESKSVEIILSEPLRSLPNGVKDRIIKRNGQWIVERNCKEVIFDGSSDENWRIHAPIEAVKTTLFYIPSPGTVKINNTDNVFCSKFPSKYMYTKDEEGIFHNHQPNIYIRILNSKLNNSNADGFKEWLSKNPISVVYQLETPIYEPLNIESSVKLFEETTYISNNSTIPTNMKITVDRAANRAKEAIEIVKSNPTIENISQARLWTNLLKESALKDEFQSEIDTSTDVVDLSIKKKTTSANVDMYIKMKNTLSLSLDTNSIIFEDYNDSEDLEKKNAVNLTVSSSLPYKVNAYLENEISNSDKTATIDKSVLNIKVNKDNDYKAFEGISTPLLLLDNQMDGNNITHSLDLILKGGNTPSTDIYKTTIKFEVVQK